MYSRYEFDTDFQDKVLACIVRYPAKFLYYANVLNSAYFSGVQRIAAARAIFAFWRKYQFFPDWNTLGQVVYEAIAGTTEQKEESTIMKYVEVLKETDTSNRSMSFRASSILPGNGLSGWPSKKAIRTFRQARFRRAGIPGCSMRL